jgi:hypothetical protein
MMENKTPIMLLNFDPFSKKFNIRSVYLEDLNPYARMRCEEGIDWIRGYIITGDAFDNMVEAYNRRHGAETAYVELDPKDTPEIFKNLKESLESVDETRCNLSLVKERFPLGAYETYQLKACVLKLNEISDFVQKIIERNGLEQPNMPFIPFKCLVCDTQINRQEDVHKLCTKPDKDQECYCCPFCNNTPCSGYLKTRMCENNCCHCYDHLV